MPKPNVLADEPLLSTEACCELLGCGRTYMSAIKRSMGHRGHKLFLSQVKEWLRKNPHFTESGVYRPRAGGEVHRALRAPRRSSTRTR